MCKVGDIIYVRRYHGDDKMIGGHSFVVISDEAGEVEGLPYDLICNVLSSFKNEEQKQKKLAIPGNFPITNADTVTEPDNGKSGFLKLDQLYYFNKEKLDYQRIGYVDYDIMQLVFEYINESNFLIRRNIRNL